MLWVSYARNYQIVVIVSRIVLGGLVVQHRESSAVGGFVDTVDCPLSNCSSSARRSASSKPSSAKLSTLASGERNFRVRGGDLLFVTEKDSCG